MQKVGTVDLNGPRKGDVLEVELISKTSRQAFFSIPNFGTGIIYGVEFINARNIIKKLKEGENTPAKIVSLDSETGYVELSLAEADKQKTWQQVKELQESGEIIKTKVAGANNGGLITEILGIKGFLPLSQLSNDHQPKVADGDRSKILDELNELIGEELSVKVIDVNPRNNKLIVSERETATANIKNFLEKYEVGQEVETIVSGTADFGVFVKFIDNPEIEGMIHISELDHRLVDNPKEIVKINDTLTVKIIDIKDGKVFLSLKALKPNPWERVNDKYKIDQEVAGKIYKFNPFGAVINLDGEIQGVIHVSKFSSQEEMKEKLTTDKEHKFIIESINSDEKRITLNFKE